MGNAAGGFVAVSQNTKNVFIGGIPVLKDLPVVGKLLFSYNYLVYLGIGTAIVLAWFLNRSRTGLNLRSVGENPGTADAAGINVTRYKYLSTCVGGGICGLGGMYVVMAQQQGVWVHNCVNGKGWIAVALVIFATWSPSRALIGSLVFGGLSVLRLYIDWGGNRLAPSLRHRALCGHGAGADRSQYPPAAGEPASGQSGQRLFPRRAIRGKKRPPRR